MLFSISLGHLYLKSSYTHMKLDLWVNLFLTRSLYFFYCEKLICWFWSWNQSPLAWLTSTTTVNPLHPNISTCIFSLLFSYHLLRCWIGEFVWQSRAILVMIIFFIPVTWMCDSGVKLYREIRCWSVLGVSGLRLVYSEGSNKVPAYVHANWFALYDSHLLQLLFLTTSNKYDGRCLVWFQSVHFVLSFVDFNFVKSRNWNYR